MAPCTVRVSGIPSKNQNDAFICSLFPGASEYELISQNDGTAFLLFPSKRKALIAITHCNKQKNTTKAILVTSGTKPIPAKAIGWKIRVTGVSGAYQNEEAFRSLFPNHISFTIEEFIVGNAVLIFTSEKEARKMERLITAKKILEGKIRITKSESFALPQEVIPKEKPIAKIKLHSFVVEELGDDIEYETVDKNLKQHVTCPICFEIMEKPYRIVECGHTFCKQCLPINAKCHTCRKQIQSPPTPDFMVNSITSSMSIYCIYSSGEGGCEWNGTLPTLKNHLKTCLLHAVRCNLCSWKGTRSQSVKHTKTCGGRYPPCKNESRGCSFLGTKQQIATHLKECPNEVIFCSNKSIGCALSNQRHLFPASHASKCLYRRVRCSDCQHVHLMIDNAEHDAICPQKKGKCSAKNCNVYGTVEELRSHKRSCQHRVLSCAYCKKNYYAYTMDDHLKECPNEVIFCSNKSVGCALSNQRHLFPASHASKCLYRRVRCSDCQHIHLMIDNAAHVAICPQKQRMCIFLGCSVRCTLATATAHHNMCEFQPVKCMECGDVVLIKDQSVHKQSCGGCAEVYCYYKDISGCTWSGHPRCIHTHLCSEFRCSKEQCKQKRFSATSYPAHKKSHEESCTIC